MQLLNIPAPPQCSLQDIYDQIVGQTKLAGQNLQFLDRIPTHSGTFPSKEIMSVQNFNFIAKFPKMEIS